MNSLFFNIMKQHFAILVPRNNILLFTHFFQQESSEVVSEVTMEGKQTKINKQFLIEK